MLVPVSVIPPDPIIFAENVAELAFLANVNVAVPNKTFPPELPPPDMRPTALSKLFRSRLTVAEFVKTIIEFGENTLIPAALILAVLAKVATLYELPVELKIKFPLPLLMMLPPLEVIGDARVRSKPFVLMVRELVPTSICLDNVKLPVGLKVVLEPGTLILAPETPRALSEAALTVPPFMIKQYPLGSPQVFVPFRIKVPLPDFPRLPVPEIVAVDVIVKLLVLIVPITPD